MLNTIFAQLIHMAVVGMIIGVPILLLVAIPHRVKLALEKRKK